MGWWNELVRRAGLKPRYEEEEEINQWEYSEGVPVQYVEQTMPLKELFLNYVERQRSANAAKEAYGIDDDKTVKAYDEANVYKRKVLDMIEEVEGK
jgi:hypothetical protein